VTPRFRAVGIEHHDGRDVPEHGDLVSFTDRMAELAKAHEDDVASKPTAALEAENARLVQLHAWEYGEPEQARHDAVLRELESRRSRLHDA
jgi:hypothetical protein